MTSESADALAIEGGTPVRTTPFPDRAIPEPAGDDRPIETLEGEFAAYIGVQPASVIALPSYESAFRLALGALEVDTAPGGEAIVPAIGAERVLPLVRESGLTVVPAEVEADTANLGPRGLSKALAEPARFAIGVHAYGHPFTASDVARVLEGPAVPLIEDASASVGASYRFRPTGTLGSAALFELAAPHLLSGGATEEPVGALLVIGDETRATAARAQRDATLDETPARIALAQLRDAEAELEARRQLAWELTFDLRARKGVSGMAHSRWVMHAYDSYVVRIRALLWKRSLDDTLAALAAEGIPCSAAFQGSLHLDSAVAAALHEDPRLDPAGFPVSSRLPSEAIALPLHGQMTDAEIADIAAALEKLEAASTGS